MLLAVAWATQTVWAQEDPNNDPAPLKYTIHITRQGDTLCDIASRPWIYGTCLKWPQIYYYNTDEIKKKGGAVKNIPFTPLPSGLNLAIILPDNARSRAEKIMVQNPALWIINVLSRARSRELSDLTVQLMDKGYYCYISKFKAQNVIWKRLRVGFFPSMESAKAKQTELKIIMDLSDAWITKASPDEALEFIGYME